MPQFDLSANSWTEVVAAGGATAKMVAINMGEALVFFGTPDPLRKAIKLGGSEPRVLHAPPGIAIYARSAGPRAIMSVGDGIGASAGTSSAPSVTVVVTFGNSHGHGRARFLGTEPRNPCIWQWTQAGAIEQLSATPRYTFDQQVGGSFDPTNQISAVLWFANKLAASGGFAANDRIFVVPHNRNGTGFSDGAWPATGAPANDLGVGVVRANTAIAAIKAQGYRVKEIIFLHHSANPDFDGLGAWDQRQVDVDGEIAYFRTNVTPADDSAFIPAIIGAGMAKSELDSQSVVNRPYQAGMAAANMRNVRTAVMDQVNPRYGRSAGLPVQVIGSDYGGNDTIHENYAGVQLMGDIYYDALIRARASATPRGAIASLSFAASAVRLWDFRTGGNANQTGAGGRISRVSNTQPPQFEFDPLLNEYALTRAASGITSTQLPFLSTAQLPASYTKWLFIKPESIAASMAFMSDTDALTAAQHRFYFTTATNELRGGHGATQNNVVIANASALFTAGAYHLVAQSYDDATDEMAISIDGTKAVASAVPAHAATRVGFLGYSNAAGGLPLVGSIAAAGVFDKALSDAELAELRTACQAMLAG